MAANFVKDAQGNRVPAKYIIDKEKYADDERRRTVRAHDFLQNLRDVVEANTTVQTGGRTAFSDNLTGLVPKLDYATDEQATARAEDNEARLDHGGGPAAVHTEYVPVVFRMDDKASSRPRTGYLIRSGDPSERSLVYGMELDDGSSLTSKGTQQLIERIKNNGGGMALGHENGELSYDLSKYAEPKRGQKWKQNRRGFIEALRSVGPGASEYTAEENPAAFPANWWGL